MRRHKSKGRPCKNFLMAGMDHAGGEIQAGGKNIMLVMGACKLCGNMISVRKNHTACTERTLVSVLRNINRSNI